MADLAERIPAGDLDLDMLLSNLATEELARAEYQVKADVLAASDPVESDGWRLQVVKATRQIDTLRRLITRKREALDGS